MKLFCIWRCNCGKQTKYLFPCGCHENNINCDGVCFGCIENNYPCQGLKEKYYDSKHISHKDYKNNSREFWKSYFQKSLAL